MSQLLCRHWPNLACRLILLKQIHLLNLIWVTYSFSLVKVVSSSSSSNRKLELHFLFFSLFLLLTFNVNLLFNEPTQLLLKSTNCKGGRVRFQFIIASGPPFCVHFTQSPFFTCQFNSNFLIWLVLLTNRFYSFFFLVYLSSFFDTFIASHRINSTTLIPKLSLKVR